ncbi:MAG: hypothetical protein RIR00_1162 [Pseudomonadota bacterium]|jgi:Flp pilus assembly protein TadD
MSFRGIDAAIAAFRAGQIAETASWVASRLEQANAAAERLPLLNLAAACARAQGDRAAAEAHWREALALQPEFSDAWGNLAILLRESGRLDQAADCYRKALQRQPGNPEFHYNHGILLRDQDQPAQAEAAYRRALQLKPDHHQAAWNLGLLKLSQGDYAAGWPLYEARLHPGRPEAITPPRLPFPRWQGQDLRGKRLLILPEQGLGDEIQFARFIPQLKARGARSITLLCHPALRSLFLSLPGVDAVHPGPKLPPDVRHDYWSHALSLPRWLGCTLAQLPGTMPYLRAPDSHRDYWQRRLAGCSGRRIGLVWRGGTQHHHDTSRSLPALASLRPLWSVPGLSFISLQKGEGENEARAAIASQPLLHLGSELVDFADTAAILEQLDLLISVDTAVTHLAGALQRPAWLLLSRQHTDWRWLQERDDSPWYPQSHRLFRQQVGENGWKGAVERLTVALRNWAEAHSRP